MSKKQLKIPTEKGRYYCDVWLELFDGGSGQWLYVCREVATYIFIDIIDMVEACGRDADVWWCAEVSVIDLLEIPPKTMADAIRSCGEERDYDFKSEMDRLRLAEMVFSFGDKARLWSGSAREVTKKDREEFRTYDERDPAFRTLRAEARRFAEESLFDEENRNRLMDNTIVNRLGQTARQFMQGTDALWGKLREIKELGDDASPEQRLVLRMYQKAGTTLGAGPVPKDLVEKT